MSLEVAHFRKHCRRLLFSNAHALRSELIPADNALKLQATIRLTSTANSAERPPPYVSSLHPREAPKALQDKKRRRLFLEGCNVYRDFCVPQA